MSNFQPTDHCDATAMPFFISRFLEMENKNKNKKSGRGTLAGVSMNCSYGRPCGRTAPSIDGAIVVSAALASCVFLSCRISLVRKASSFLLYFFGFGWARKKWNIEIAMVHLLYSRYTRFYFFWPRPPPSPYVFRFGRRLPCVCAAAACLYV